MIPASTSNGSDENFGFRASQNISQSYPIDFNNITDIFNLSLPEELPQVTKEHLINNDNNDHIIDDNYIEMILNILNNMLQEVPKFQMPPLFNVENLHFKNKYQTTFINDVINSSQFKYQLPISSQSMTTTPPPTTTTTIPQSLQSQQLPNSLYMKEKEQQQQSSPLYMSQTGRSGATTTTTTQSQQLPKSLHMKEQQPLSTPPTMEEEPMLKKIRSY